VPAPAPPADLQSPPDPGPQAPPAKEPAAAELPAPVAARLEGVLLDEASLPHSPMVPYVRMVVSLIEGREFTCQEVVQRLRRTLRQHRIGAREQNGYLRGFLHEHPP